ncbi:mucin-5AC [Sitodiplosis mosellana]|uniref:mucin-5AC n=1 Tax=Sitodiplosis mosellana TaxID=263140 RepID=UPI002444A36D|nr:mucin-5AC [Sitodiplosis mosellana]XP_055296769.1 mucin-5AC [Sitodiplosis mosellana]
MRQPFGIYFILGLLLCIQSEHLTVQAQSRRPSTIARSLGVNPKGSASSDAFQCPEEFGYYPHPSDCSQYYVCVFGGALLESCTGGLMYSHELQTCDWPRNVGCEASDENVSSNGSGRELNGRQQQQQQQQQHDAYQVVPNKFRFSSVSSTPQTDRYPDSIPVRHSSVSPVTQQTLAPLSNTLPPQPFVQPNPVITSRGQPKPLDNLDIAKLYEAHDTLPPIEEEESDRQQRVYRGQPSTVGQVQRDRDGLITQHVNALPSHGKVGSFSFGSQINQHSDIPDVVSIDITDNKIETQTAKHLDRKKRDVDESEDIATTETRRRADNGNNNDDYVDGDVDDDHTSSNGNESHDDEHDETATTPIETGKRTVRQLRPPPPIGPWQFSVDNFNLPNEPRLHSTSRAHPQAGHFQRDTELSSVNYNTFLTPPGSARSNDFYKNENPYYQLPSFKQTEYNPYGNPYGNFKNSAPNAVTEFNSPKPYTIHTTFDVGDAQQTHFKPSKLVSQAPFYPLVPNGGGAPKPVQKGIPNSAISSSATGDPVDSLPENFSYYHMANGVQIKQEFNRHPSQSNQQNLKIQQVRQPQAPLYYLDKPAKILSASTPKTHYVHISTVGGFLNNNPTAFATINHNKKPKLRPNTVDKYNDYTHRPVYREPAAVHENNQNNNIYGGNAYNVQENTDVSTYYNPLVSQRPNIVTPVAVSTVKPVFNNELPFSNFEQKSQKPLYSFEVTTDELKPTEKNNGFYITQTLKDANVEKFTRPSIKLQSQDQKNYEPPKSYEVIKNYDAPKNYDDPVIIGGAKKRPPIVGPQVGVNFDFNKFVYNIRESQHLPKPTPKYNAIARPIEPDTVLIRPQNKPVPKKIQTTTAIPDDYYYDVDEEPLTTTAKKTVPPTTTLKHTKEPAITTHKHTTSTLAEYTTKPVKTNYINGFSSPHSISTPQTFETSFKGKDPKVEEDYYEYEDEDYSGDIKLPPQNVSKFMPMSETAAPRPYSTTVKSLTILTQRPLTTPPPTITTTTTKKHSTTTFDRSHYTKSSTETTSPIPAIITFPEDVFQGVRHNEHRTDIPRYLNQSTLRPYTLRTRNKPTNLSGPVKTSKAPKTRIKTTIKTTSSSKLTTLTSEPTTTTTLTTSTPKTKTFTIRAKHNNYNTGKGQQQQHQSQSQSQSQSTNSNRWKQENKAQKAQRTNALKKNLWELDERLPNRVESSSQLPSAPESNRNYYNATSNQEYNNPTQYNSYFSVYDDEAEDTGDLYRDDYPAQYNNNRNPSQPKYVQTTYRPSTTLTTQTQSTSTKSIPPPHQPQQTYISNSKPNYDQAPAHEAYNPEYDEALVAQLEADNEYDQPTKTQVRSSDVTKNRTSSSESIKFTLGTRAGYPFSNTQSQNHHQYNQQQQYNHQIPRYPSSSPNPTILSQTNAPTKPRNNNYNRDANKLKLDPDHSQTYTLTTGFRYNNNNNNNFDKTSNANRTYRIEQQHQKHQQQQQQQQQKSHSEPIDTTKSYRQQSVAITKPSVSSTTDTNYNEHIRDESDQEQRKKYLDFIVSDKQPQSFQAPSKTRVTSTKPLSPSEKELVNAFVNSQSSLFIQSTPKSHVITTLPNKQTESQPISAIHIPSSRLPSNDTYRFSLTTGLSNGKRNQNRNPTETDDDRDSEHSTDNYQHASHAESENIPLYVRKPQTTNSIESTFNSIHPTVNSIHHHSTSNSITPLKHEIIVPTTYSPLRNWKIQYLKKPTLPGSEVFNTVVDTVAPDDMKKLIFGQPINRTKSEPNPSAAPSIHRDVVAPKSKTVSKFSFTFDGDKDYERPSKTQSRQPTKFPSLEFRERLNRTFDTTTSKPLISPYASLQTILEDIKPTQYRPSLGSYSITIGKNNIQSNPTPSTTTTTTTTTRAPPAPTSSSFFKSYFIITAPPKNTTQKNYVSSTQSTPASYTPFSSSPSSSTTPISITTNYPTVSSTERPFEWTPIASSVFPNQLVNNIQILPSDERFRPMRPSIGQIDITTEKPIISITTSFPQKSNYDNYLQHSSIPNSVVNENFPPYQTTTPISITTSTPQFSVFPNQIDSQAPHGLASPSGFSPIPSFPQQGRDHYRKVVRMRSKKKLNNSAGGLTPVILNPNVQEFTEDDPDLDQMRNNNFMKAVENVLSTEQKVEQSTKGYRKPSKRPTTRIPNIHVSANEGLRPSSGKNVQFMVEDDGKLVKYTVMNDNVAPTKFFSNYRHVKDEEEQESIIHHSLGDYIKDSPKYSIVKDDEEQESKQHATLEDYVKDGANQADDIPGSTDEILSIMTDTEEPIPSSTELHPDEREKFRATVEMPEFNVPTESEIKSRLKQLESEAEKDVESEYQYETTTKAVATRKYSTDLDLTNETHERNQIDYEPPTTHIRDLTYVPLTVFDPMTSTTIRTNNDGITTSTQTRLTTSTTQKSYSSTNSVQTLPSRASRVNPAIKTTIAGTPTRRMNPHTTPAIRFHQHTTPIVKCIDAKCNEIPSRTNNRNRGSSHYTSGGYDDRTPSGPTSNRGTHPPRIRPTLKPSGSIVSKATEFVDIYRNPPTRPEPLYPQPIPDKTAAKCRKDVCLLPDCYCGGRDIPGDMPVEDVPQIVLLTFDDSVNDLNKQLYSDLFGKGRVNPNGCPISATFYVSHEWTDYSQVQNLYSDGHEMASHTVSHSFGEQFSQKKWTREVAGQREILAAYGGVKLNDVRGMRAPFLSIGGNKMFKMLYDSNFTYDSSMPVYENRPPSWPYTLDYKIFHDCMIPPCPTKSYPGVWQVPMVMWQDLNGGRCSMGDACSNPPDSDGVVKMIMKNFERHYTTNRAPFGLFYHAAWFTQPHHKEGFIKFLDTINAMNDVWIVTNWQALQWVRDPTPLSRMNSFQPFQCNYQDRPKRCNNPKVCNLWHKSGVRYMRTCQPCPEIYPWTGKSGIRSSRVDNDIDE